MGTIIVSENVTLDGVAHDPTGEEGTRHGGWFSHMTDRDREEWAKVECDEALGAEALLMGRRTYEYFVARGWPAMTGVWADRLNSLPKHVVSSTLQDPEWSNSTVLSGDVVEAATRLRQEVDGEIVVYASQGLVPTLMEHGLVDEIRLTVHPYVLGAGERVFGETTDTTALRLVDHRRLGDGLAYVTYDVVRA